jgi:hypothetical protein
VKRNGEDSEDEKKKKSVAFKATSSKGKRKNKEEESSEDESSSSIDEIKKWLSLCAYLATSWRRNDMAQEEEIHHKN